MRNSFSRSSHCILPLTVSSLSSAVALFLLLIIPIAQAAPFESEMAVINPMQPEDATVDTNMTAVYSERLHHHRTTSSAKSIPQAIPPFSPTEQETPAVAVIPRDLFDRYNAVGQGHVFAHVDRLSVEQQNIFWKHLQSTPVERAVANLALALDAAAATASPVEAPFDGDVVVPESLSQAERDSIWQTGLKAIRDGQVAVVTLAGGQGTRLGSSAPKGCYDVGLPSHKTLFQLQGERLLKVSQLAGAPVVPRWFVMTSSATHQATVDFFKVHNFFGIPADRVRFFSQGEMPAMTIESGRLMMSALDRVAMSPDGNGGVYVAMKHEGVLDQMQREGIKHVHMYCVDNVLARVADPAFIGAAIVNGADCAAKTVRRTDPTEPVGVFCRRSQDSAMVVVEYSEISPELASQRNADGSGLLLGQANIANHYFSVDFLERAVDRELPMHLARKKIPAIDEVTGADLDPRPMGFKLEAFIFDAMSLARRPLLIECNRLEEFAPLKNAQGAKADSPDHCRDALLRLHRIWRQSNAEIPASADGSDEIPPSVSYRGEFHPSN